MCCVGEEMVVEGGVGVRRTIVVCGPEGEGDSAVGPVAVVVGGGGGANGDAAEKSK